MQFIRLVAVLAALIPLMATAASARPYGMAEVLRRVPKRAMPDSSSTRPRVALKPTSNKFRRLGRWTMASPYADSLAASWCGASISFCFSGSYLSIRTGSRTERKDSFNGGTPMIACSVSARSEGGGDSSTNENQVKTYDCGPSQEVVLVDEDTPTARPVPVKITLTLVDWASVFELESVVVDNEDSVQAFPDDPRSVRVLAIGDSITAGYSDGSQPIPLGCLSAYPHIAKAQLHARTGIELELELVAFPGVTLVAPTPEEADEGAGQGMIDRFFHASQWSDGPAALDEQPSIIVIALGTNDDAQDVSPINSPQPCMLSSAHPFPDFTADSDPETTESAEQVSVTRDLSSALASLRSNAGQGVEFHEWDIGGDLRREHTMDGLHPTIYGHHMLGDTLAKQLTTLVSSIAVS
ncbi:uncharacterized protein B0H18DRAFT_1129075 [Fomitopsis serialis]|uniref:uncharacterized protein n=1 Tax=Fomitopsis serialis TaxID=139415 RepID=UPI0020082422|nr:uncharacterized protein B0H18DRAFT_1129075 [Neoantrodia serialis]KAH9911169.1 hypothetical protein B0H18DRAFT_1129075 [Neoantrodia serialis]